MAKSIFSISLSNLKEISKIYIQRHKEMLFALRSVEPKSKSFHINKDSNRLIHIDSHSYENLIKISSLLIDLDDQSYKTLHYLHDYSKVFEKIEKKSKAFKVQFESFKKSVSKDLQSFSSFTSDCVAKFANHSISLKVLLDEKLTQVVSSLVSQETISLFSKEIDPGSPLRLLSSFYKDFSSDEPELELSTKTDNKRYLNHISFLTQSLESVSESLLSIIRRPFPVKKPLNLLDIPKFNASLTPTDQQILIQKIGKLHNRGSLTDEEARNMLCRISVIPVSPENESPAQDINSKNLSIELFTEDTPTMTLHPNSKTPMTQSFGKDFKKRKNIFRKISRKIQTPKISRNTSLPRASALIKFEVRNAKKIKQKSRSPHSFLYM